MNFLLIFSHTRTPNHSVWLYGALKYNIGWEVVRVGTDGLPSNGLAFSCRRGALPTTFKKRTISRAEGGQLQPPIRHAVRRYDRNCSAQRILGYNSTTPELRPEHALVRLSPCCNLVPSQQRCRYWWRAQPP